jgi:hypothetical protein
MSTYSTKYRIHQISHPQFTENVCPLSRLFTKGNVPDQWCWLSIQVIWNDRALDSIRSSWAYMTYIYIYIYIYRIRKEPNSANRTRIADVLSITLHSCAMANQSNLCSLFLHLRFVRWNRRPDELCRPRVLPRQLHDYQPHYPARQLSQTFVRILIHSTQQKPFHFP